MGESRNPQHLRKGQDLQQVRQVLAPIVAVARESRPEGCRSHCISSQARTHALHLLLAPLQFPLQVLNLLVLCNQELLKLMSLNSGSTLYRPQKDTMPK
jgi:hypothetical protein